MTTRRLLLLGAAAGPLYIVLGIGQILTRDGFDMRRHALSLLSNGEYGWIQIGSFILSGVLVGLGAVGVRKALHPGRAGTWGPNLLFGYAIGLIGAGIFKADPGLGFPPGTPESGSVMSQSGMLHFVFGGIGFYALIGCSLVFARRFVSLQERGWAWYSGLSGIAFLVAFIGIASGNNSPAIILPFYAAVAWIWLWLTAVLLRISRDLKGAR